MEAQARTRLHPLVAGAAVAVIVAGGVAVAAITGYLPGSKAEIALEKAVVSHPAKQSIASPASTVFPTAARSCISADDAAMRNS